MLVRVPRIQRVEFVAGGLSSAVAPLNRTRFTLDRRRACDFAVSSALVDGALTPAYYDAVERMVPGPSLGAVVSC